METRFEVDKEYGEIRNRSGFIESEQRALVDQKIFDHGILNDIEENYSISFSPTTSLKFHLFMIFKEFKLFKRLSSETMPSCRIERNFWNFRKVDRKEFKKLSRFIQTWSCLENCFHFNLTFSPTYNQTLPPFRYVFYH
ncbi:unnamed protein product [Moneuplotes crassus]|uniref:Uncharacterized protein n=1 Tax=Euplotes crassus TaxID=5936 RepID=A0AAD1U5C2_EUPCR|nr:unnamed protein product [Moneuplotes crassus]